MRQPALFGLTVLLLSSILASVPASAAGNCVTDLYGRIECQASDSRPGSGAVIPGSGSGSVNAAPASTLPPRRYLQTRFDLGVGNCWVWSRSPPGLDAWDNANDAAIINTRSRLPACPRATPPPAADRVDVPGTAWSIFREFDLVLPLVRMQPPDHGITGLPTYVSTQQPAPLNHTERLPNGRNLEVRAEIVGVEVTWGDGAVTSHELGALRPYPGGAAIHTYATRTCSASYRAEHPTAGTCHPTLEAYPLEVTHQWRGRYRYDAGWVDLGIIERTTSRDYDVDEVVGVLQP